MKAQEEARGSRMMRVRGLGGAVFSPAELRDLEAAYLTPLTPGERRILAAAPQEARLAFAELRRSERLRDYMTAAEIRRMAKKAAALGVIAEDRGTAI